MLAITLLINEHEWFKIEICMVIIRYVRMVFILFCIGSNPVLGDVLCVGSGVLFALTTVSEELLIKGEIGIIDFLAFLGFSGTVVSSIQLLVLSDYITLSYIILIILPQYNKSSYILYKQKYRQTLYLAVCSENSVGGF